MDTKIARREMDHQLIRRLRQQAAVAEISRQALGGLGLLRLMQLVSRRVRDLLAVDHCVLLERTRDGGLRRLGGTLPAGASLARPAWPPRSALFRSLSRPESQNLKAHDLTPEESELLAGTRRREGLSVFAIPLLSDGSIQGLFCVAGGKRAASFPDDDRQFLEVMAQTLSAAIDLDLERRGQARFHDLLDATTDVVIITDPEGTVEYLNAAAARLLDLPHSEKGLGFNLLTMLQGDYRTLFLKKILPFLRREDLWHGKVRLRDGKGRTLSFSQEAMAHRDDRGELARISIIARPQESVTVDGSDTGTTGSGLDKAQGRSRVMTNQLSLDGHWLSVSPGFTQRLGVAAEDLVGRHYTYLVCGPDSAADDADVLAPLLRGDADSVHFEQCYRGYDGDAVRLETDVTMVQSEEGAANHLLCQMVDVTERRRIEEALVYRSRFLELIVELSAQLVCAPAERVDPEIHNALSRVGGLENVDRAYLLQFDQSARNFHCTHEWCAQGVDPAIQSLQPLPAEDYAWLLASVRRGETIRLSTLDAVPAEAASDRQRLEEKPVQSLLICPLMVGERVIGAMGLETVDESREWSEDTELMVRLAGQLLINVLQRRRADEALRESEHRYQVLVENAAEGILVYDVEERRFTEANANALALLKVDRVTLAETPLEGFLPDHQPDGRSSMSALRELIDRTLRGERPVVEWTWRSSMGTSVPTELRLVQLPGADRGKVRASMLDLTEHKRAEKHLLNERFFTDSAINSLPGIFYLCDRQGRLKRWNRRLENLTGFSGEALSGTRLQDLFVASDRPQVWRDLQKVLDTGESSLEAGLIVADGSVVPFLLTGMRTDADGDSYLVGTGMDVSERHANEQERIAFLQRTRTQHQTISRVATSAAVAEGELETVHGDVSMRLAEGLQATRAGIWLFSDDNRELRCVELYSRDDGVHQSGEALDMGQCSRYVRALQESICIDAVDVSADPRTQELLDIYLRPLDIRALLNTPIRMSGRVVGVLSVEQVGIRRQWAVDEVSFVGAMADQVAQAMINLERRQSAAALRESEWRYRVLYDLNPSMFFTVDTRGYVRSANRFAAEMLGHDLDELVGKPFGTLHVGEDRAHIEHHLRQCLEADGDPRRWDARLSRADGDTLWVRVTARSIHDIEGSPVILAVCEDITEARKLSEELSYQASHDALTGLYNRREFEHRLNRALRVATDSEVEHALLYMDLDQFKVINDTCGHIAGDELLRQIAEVLRSRVSRRDTLARLGGDEFGVLLEHCTPENARRVAEAVRVAIADFRFIWAEQGFGLGVSIGVVPITAGSGSINDVLSLADTACYAAKDQGRNRIHVYRENDAELARRHGEMQWVNRIRHALDEKRFELHYQSITPAVATRQIDTHVELLIRLRDSEGKLVMPRAFLPAAERYDLAPGVDRWVVLAAVEWLERRLRDGVMPETCFINVSGHSMGDADFLGFMLSELRNVAVPAERLCFEITETAAIRNLSTATRFIRILREEGCRFALDDFGSGLSSFAYLKNLPVDYLKIDGVFVKDIVDDPINLAVVRSINDIGHVMGKRTIAEFVESPGIAQSLVDIGVDFLQGFAISRPAPLETFRSPGPTTPVVTLESEPGLGGSRRWKREE